MKPLRFLGISLLVAAGLSLATALMSVVMQVWTPTYLPYYVVNPMYVFWARMVVTGFVAMGAFGLPGLMCMAATESDR